MPINKVKAKNWRTLIPTVCGQVDSEDAHLVNVTGAGLGYSYQLTTAVLHWGEGAAGGSEHSVGGRGAALELQLLGYNGQLYPRHTTAARSPNGVVGVAVLAQVSTEQPRPRLGLNFASSRSGRRPTRSWRGSSRPPVN